MSSGAFNKTFDKAFDKARTLGSHAARMAIVRAGLLAYNRKGGAQSTPEIPTAEDMTDFGRAQKLAYDCAVAAAETLRVGMSERELADWILSYLKDHDIKAHFHWPLVWFGERTRTFADHGELAALPQKSVILEREDTPVLIDMAPIQNGAIGDIGFSFSLKPNEELIKARAFLLKLRAEIPARFNDPAQTTAQIWKWVDDEIRAAGYENCHTKYAYHTLAHRVRRVPFTWLTGMGTGLYTPHAYWILSRHGIRSDILGPKHKGDKRGLWAIEPHMGRLGPGGFGAKFEEILVVDDQGARWLDNTVPHVTLDRWPRLH